MFTASKRPAPAAPARLLAAPIPIARPLSVQRFAELALVAAMTVVLVAGVDRLVREAWRHALAVGPQDPPHPP